MPDPVRRGRAAYDRAAWRQAVEELAAAEPDDLAPDDLERLATAAYLTGRDAESAAAWAAAFGRHLAAGDRAAAGRCGFWLAFGHLMGGRPAQAGAWLARVEATVAELDCAAAGYLLVPRLLQALDAGDGAQARELAGRARDAGARHGDADLRALGTLGEGQALLALGDVDAGVARLDDVMLAVTSGEVGPVAAGIAYCAVVLECLQLFDLPRAAEWTDALAAWCDGQPDLVPFRGQCLVHQSQLQQAAGNWAQATATAQAACLRLADPPQPALGLARYQEGELHRLTGAFDAADEAYRAAGRAGHEPVPGVALLDLARGRPAEAAATVRRALADAPTAYQRPGLLAAAVDVLPAAGDLDRARAAAAELRETATRLGSPVLDALADHCTGAVRLADGDAVGALPVLRAAADAWRRLGMSYECARVAVLRARACAALGDRASASRELDAACDAFRRLGASPDLAAASAFASALRDPPRRSEPLSERERQVLAQLAEGRSNRQIAEALVLSPHTVGRHVEHIFAKLGVSSRAAATARAFEQHLLP